MPLPFQLAFLAFMLMVPVYMYAFLRFYGIVRKEQPDWVKRRGSLSFFYDGLPRAFDPNVTFEVIRVAYSSRVGQLQSPMAAPYAKRIRVLLPLGTVLFLVGVIGAVVSAP
jgi:hypothetical protein